MRRSGEHANAAVLARPCAMRHALGKPGVQPAGAAMLARCAPSRCSIAASVARSGKWASSTAIIPSRVSSRAAASSMRSRMRDIVCRAAKQVSSVVMRWPFVALHQGRCPALCRKTRRRTARRFTSPALARRRTSSPGGCARGPARGGAGCCRAANRRTHSIPADRNSRAC